MNNRIRTVSIIVLAMSISVIGLDDAMAREKKQTGASIRAPLNSSPRNRGSVRPANNNHIAFKEAWAEYYSTPARTLNRASRPTGMGRSSSFNAGEPSTMDLEFAKLPRDVPGHTQRPGQRSKARHSSVVAPQNDPRHR